MAWESIIVFCEKGAAETWHTVGYFCPLQLKSDLTVQYNAEVCDTVCVCACVYQQAALRMRRECFESVCDPGKGRERCGGECIRSMATSSWPPTWDNPPIAHTAANSSGECTHLHRFWSGNRGKLALWESALFARRYRHNRECACVTEWGEAGVYTSSPYSSLQHWACLHKTLHSHLFTHSSWVSSQCCLPPNYNIFMAGLPLELVANKSQIITDTIYTIVGVCWMYLVHFHISRGDLGNI